MHTATVHWVTGPGLRRCLSQDSPDRLVEGASGTSFQEQLLPASELRRYACRIGPLFVAPGRAFSVKSQDNNTPDVENEDAQTWPFQAHDICNQVIKRLQVLLVEPPLLHNITTYFCVIKHGRFSTSPQSQNACQTLSRCLARCEDESRGPRPGRTKKTFWGCQESSCVFGRTLQS